jgi:hypothetical protein
VNWTNGECAQTPFRLSVMLIQQFVQFLPPKRLRFHTELYLELMSVIGLLLPALHIRAPDLRPIPSRAIAQFFGHQRIELDWAHYCVKVVSRDRGGYLSSSFYPLNHRFDFPIGWLLVLGYG